MKVLITGAAGFIGSHLVRTALTQGYEVVALDDLSGGYVENVPAEAVFVRGSVCDEAFIAGLFQEHRFHAVYHLAAYAAEGLSHFIRNYNYRTNLIGSTTLINQCVLHQVGSFVFTSSIAVYGAGQLPLTESTVPEPEDPYGVSKYAVELDLKAAHRMFGLNWVVFRPHNVYGEYQNIADKYRNVIGIFMNQALKGEPFTVFGDGEQTRAFSYVGDIVGPMLEAAFRKECHGEVFNIGADQPYSVNKLAEIVTRALDVPLRKRHLAARQEVVHAYASHEKIQRFFGVRPSTPLEEGIERMARWVRVVGARQTPAFANIEVARNLPEGW